MPNKEDKMFGLTDDLVFVVSEQGIAIADAEGKIYLIYNAEAGEMQASKALVRHLKEFRTKTDIEIINKESVTLH